MRCRFKPSGMVDFIPGERTDLICGNRGQRDGVAIIGGELNHETLAVLDHMHDRANVTGHQPVFRQVHRQRHTIKFSDHAVEDRP